MPETKGELRTPVGFRDDGTVRALALTDDDELKVSSGGTVQDDILTALELIDDLRGALDSVDTDELVVNVDESALPTGAATSAHQLTMITALQLIDDLRKCLNSVDTDVLLVKTTASVLPVGAATSAHQLTMITALQLIDDLRGALDSVDTDELVVNVDESVLPTGAATSAAQATLETEAALNLKTADLEIVTDIPSVGSHGWVSGALQKQPIMLGYSNILRELAYNINLAAGTSSVTSVTVPAGEIWHFTQWSFYVVSATISRVYLDVYVDGAKLINVVNQPDPRTGDLFTGIVDIVMKEDGHFRLTVEDATLGDDIMGRFAGVITDIDQ